ncbi:NUDIX hydrolase [Psychrobacillus vulpis]|uniref:NUDIX domain-containing protein n=1 Tax=Psychrobacillus vulpis TaxID=2325572 RepID=A0A544TW08_9BACI|nr:NUDIX domain-containing protein [Psychrobacillus vulpis]TQR21633.1 NUDIX domain-containing protein [Psychrobacillus vulpis]
MRNRGATVIIENGRIALIKRTKPYRTYFVFPGGGIESGETPEEAAIRETYEELGVNVQIQRLLKKLELNGTQYFFLANIVSGTFGSGTGEEYNHTSVKRGTYEPMWIEIDHLPLIEVRPKEIVDILLSL